MKIDMERARAAMDATDAINAEIQKEVVAALGNFSAELFALCGVKVQLNLGFGATEDGQKTVVLLALVLSPDNQPMHQHTLKTTKYKVWPETQILIMNIIEELQEMLYTKMSPLTSLLATLRASSKQLILPNQAATKKVLQMP